MWFLLFSAEPKFSAPITNVTAPVGREAILACIVQDLSAYKVLYNINTKLHCQIFDFEVSTRRACLHVLCVCVCVPCSQLLSVLRAIGRQCRMAVLHSVFGGTQFSHRWYRKQGFYYGRLLCRTASMAARMWGIKVGLPWPRVVNLQLWPGPVCQVVANYSELNYIFWMRMRFCRVSFAFFFCFCERLFCSFALIRALKVILFVCDVCMCMSFFGVYCIFHVRTFVWTFFRCTSTLPSYGYVWNVSCKKFDIKLK